MEADTVILRQLNQDFVQSVERSDVRRFDEILADDFLNSNPDGSLVDRAGRACHPRLRLLVMQDL